MPALVLWAVSRLPCDSVQALRCRAVLGRESLCQVADNLRSPLTPASLAETGARQ